MEASERVMACGVCVCLCLCAYVHAPHVVSPLVRAVRSALWVGRPARPVKVCVVMCASCVHGLFMHACA